MRLQVNNKTVEDKQIMNEIVLDFESVVEKSVFSELTHQMLTHGTHVAVSSIIDSNGVNRIGFRVVDKPVHKSIDIPALGWIGGENHTERGR